MTDLTPIQAGVLLVGFAYAAAADVRDREVADLAWVVMGVAGAALGFVAFGAGSAVAAASWFVVSALTLEHTMGWDRRLPPRWRPHADRIELGGYALAFVVLALLAARYGVGPGGVTGSALAVLVTVLLARGLFELGALWGGADAKALMVAGLLVPTWAVPWLGTPSAAEAVLPWLPFALTVLTNAALVSAIVPLYLAVRNAVRGEFHGGRGFTGYSLESARLPDRFVWVRDPRVPRDTAVEDAETSEEDRQHRRAIARSLAERGIDRVWVSPQLPFVLLLAVGTVAGFLFGNLVLDAIAAL